jgi:hypothetical protein
MGPYYIQPGTPVYFEIIILHGAARRTLHGFVQSDTGVYVTVIVPSMNNKTFVATHSALTYDDTPEAVTPAPLPIPSISFDELISQGR